MAPLVKHPVTARRSSESPRDARQLTAPRALRDASSSGEPAPQGGHARLGDCGDGRPRWVTRVRRTRATQFVGHPGVGACGSRGVVTERPAPNGSLRRTRPPARHRTTNVSCPPTSARYSASSAASSGDEVPGPALSRELRVVVSLALTHAFVRGSAAAAMATRFDQRFHEPPALRGTPSAAIGRARRVCSRALSAPPAVPPAAAARSSLWTPSGSGRPRVLPSPSRQTGWCRGAPRISALRPPNGMPGLG